jgi:hypothetical protein
MTTLTMTTKKNLLYIFASVWLVANVVLAWLLMQGQVAFKLNSIWIASLVLIPCNLILLNLIRNPIREDPAVGKTAKGKLFGLIAVVVIAVVFLTVGPGKFFILTFPIVAAVILFLQKQPLDKREWLYAAFLALIAGVAGLGAQWIKFITPVQWSLLQVPLTLFCFLAGWSILRRTGLLQQGVGRSRFLAEGALPAVRSFLLGILLGTPWALASVVMGSAESSRATWVQSWWQPLVALDPGVAEEAWGRFLWVPLAFLLFRRVSPNRTAFSIALVVMAYLFAFLHTSGDGVTMLVSTLITGTLFVLPVSVVCLYRDLETAIGFHFWMDFIKFVSALLLFNG